MKLITSTRKDTNPLRLAEQLTAAYPDILSISTGPYGVKVRVPDDFTNQEGVLTIIDTHDPTELSQAEIVAQLREAATARLRALTDRSTTRTKIETNDPQGLLELFDMVDDLLTVLVE